MGLFVEVLPLIKYFYMFFDEPKYYTLSCVDENVLFLNKYDIELHKF